MKLGASSALSHEYVRACVQLGFFNIVGIPLFKTMVELFEDAQPMLDGVLANFRHWEAGTAEEDLPN